MKKIISIIAVTALMLATAACGGRGDEVAQSTPSAESQATDVNDTSVEGAGKDVDMNKVDGERLDGRKVDGVKSKGEISGFDVSIDEAKVMTTEESKILVVSFSFKNTSSEPAAFGNIFSVDVTQDGGNLMPTVINTDGVNILSGVEQIESGSKTKVQKTYVLSDEENPVEVSVYKYGEPTGGILKKIFELK